MGDDTGGLRRRPVQRRSAERVRRLLDSCAELLDEAGYEALTTREVARRAGVPIGTLYQFFGDRQALVRALAERNLGLFTARLRDRLPQAAPARWAEAAGPVIDVFVKMKREVPGFAVVDFADNEVVARQLADLGTVGLGLPDRPGLDLVLLVAVEAADSLLKLAFQRRADGDPALIAEAAALVGGYLEQRLDRGAGAPGGGPG